ncbi:MAG: DNA-deoxyinosine glycosylase [Bacilli bacterium]|nr:DNA-deoxyinosine glycosylase [Bacilli bacterium]
MPTNKKKNHVDHKSIPPFINNNSNILILGSLPSVKSREDGFFYAHPQNRFFKILAGVFNEEEPKTIEERKAFLLRNHIALYDVIFACDIYGSSDATIENVEPINLKNLLKQYSNIKKIFTTGKKAKELYDKYLLPEVEIKATSLPSSSAANASMNLETLIEKYKVILEH